MGLPIPSMPTPSPYSRHFLAIARSGDLACCRTIVLTGCCLLLVAMCYFSLQASMPVDTIAGSQTLQKVHSLGGTCGKLLGSHPKERPGLWPPASKKKEDFSSCNQGPRRRQRPCAQPRTQFGNPCTPIGSQGPFQAGGQAPPIHQGTKILAGQV